MQVSVELTEQSFPKLFFLPLEQSSFQRGCHLRGRPKGPHRYCSSLAWQQRMKN